MTTLPISAITVGDRSRTHMGDIDALARSIAKVGLLQPILVKPDGNLIAGARRLAACKLLGLADIPVTVATNLDDAILALTAERDENTCRENFAPSEAIEIGKRLEALERPKAQERQSTLNNAETASSKLDEATGRTDDKVSGAVGMKRQTYRKAKKVVDAAAAQPDLLGDVVTKMDETGNVSAALKEVQKRLRDQKEQQVLATLPPVDDRFTLHHGDFRSVCATLGECSIDVIITDPPYDAGSLFLFNELADVASFVLVHGGSLLVMVGQSYLPEVIARLRQRLTYHWTLAYLTPGGQSAQLWQRKVNTFWKPVLWFVKGEYRGPWVGDVVSSAVNDNCKGLHKWQQAESGMADLVKRCTQAGDLVLDPMCGSGTTGLVALSMGRRFIGIDSDQAVLDTARVRLAEALHGAG